MGKNIHKEVSDALNEISVNCPNIDIFEKASAYAFNKNKEGYSYAESFIDYQNNLSQTDNSNKTIEKPLNLLF